jgi:hypothetical protein
VPLLMRSVHGDILRGTFVSVVLRDQARRRVTAAHQQVKVWTCLLHGVIKMLTGQPEAHLMNVGYISTCMYGKFWFSSPTATSEDQTTCAVPISAGANEQSIVSECYWTAVHTDELSLCHTTQTCVNANDKIVLQE